MACSQKVELVSQNYYEQELQFQGQLDRLNRTRQLAVPARISYDPVHKLIAISLPPEQQARKVTGHINLYRPSAAGQDRQLTLQTDEQGVQTLDATQLEVGLWKLRLSWQVDGREYFHEQQLVIGSKS
jgi:nitrogen fixation protein FixH